MLHRAMDRLPPALELRLGFRVVTAFKELYSTKQLAIVQDSISFQRSIRRSLKYGTTRFGFVLTIPETTMDAESGDILERIIHAAFGVPQLHLPHAGCVNQDSTCLLYTSP